MLLTLATWACGCRVWFSGGCRGSCVAGLVRGDGGHWWRHGGRAESRWWLWMKKEVVSQFVMRVTLDQRSNACTRTITLPPKFVVYLTCTVVFIIQSYRVPLNLVVSAFSLQKFVVFAFWHYKIHILLFFHYKVCDIRFFITNFCSVSILRPQKFVVSTYWHYKIL